MLPQTTAPIKSFPEAYRQYCAQHSAPESRVILNGYQALPKRRFQLLLDEMSDERELESLVNILHRNRFGLERICLTISQPALDAYHQRRQQVYAKRKNVKSAETRSGEINKQNSSNYAVNSGKPPKHSAVLVKTTLLGSLVKSIKSQLVSSSQSLQELELSGMRLTLPLIAMLACSLQHTHQLTKLSFCRSEMGDQGLQALNQPLRTMRSLRWLIISGCQLSRKSVRLLLDILKFRYVTSRTTGWIDNLRSFDDENFNGANRSRQSIRSASMKTTTSNNNSSSSAISPIKRLDLSRNYIGNDGGRLLAETLGDQIDLIALDLQFNGITSQTVMESLIGLPTENNQLLLLDLRNNCPMGLDMRKRLHHQLLVNVNEILYETAAEGTKDLTHIEQIAVALKDPELEWLDERECFRSGYDPQQQKHLKTRLIQAKITTSITRKPSDTLIANSCGATKKPLLRQSDLCLKQPAKQRSLQFAAIDREDGQTKTPSVNQDIKQTNAISSVSQIVLEKRLVRVEQEQQKFRKQSERFERLLDVMEQSIGSKLQFPVTCQEKSGENVTKELLVKRAEHNDGDLSTLEEITLHQYDIEKIELLDVYCKRLRILYLQSNQIMRIENLSKLKELEYINLALNNIRMIEGLEWCESLKKLDLTINFIENPLCIQRLRSNERLSDLFLTGNACTQLEGYRLFVIHSLPQLKLLDGQTISRTERIQAEQQYPRLLKEFEMKFSASERHLSIPPQTDAVANENSTTDADKKNFNEEITRHTPEDRLRTARELAERRGNGESMDHLKPRPPQAVPEPSFHPETGRIMQRNDGKYEFRFHHYADRLVLEVDLPKYMDTSLIELDVKPCWVKAVIKGKPLYLALDYEVLPDESEAKRCISTGQLQVNMPLTVQAGRDIQKSNPLLGRRKPEPTFTGYMAGQRAPAKDNIEAVESTTMLDVYDENTLAEKLRFVDEQAAKRFTGAKAIKAAKSLRQPAAAMEFEDDPEVPPLE